MIAKPTIHPLAAHHLKELREKWGVEPTLEETLWIVRLCERVINPGLGANAGLIGIPERCGASDVWLWPATIGAMVWWREFAFTWWEGDSERIFIAQVFALAHARDKDVFTMCRTREAAEAMIYDWRLSLTCTREEIEDAFDRLLPPDARPRPKSDSKALMDWSTLVAEIEVSSGIPSEHWLWKVSRVHTIEAWHASKRIIAAQSGRSSNGLDAADEAIQDLAYAKSMIVDAHKGRATAPPPSQEESTP